MFNSSHEDELDKALEAITKLRLELEKLHKNFELLLEIIKNALQERRKVERPKTIA